MSRLKLATVICLVLTLMLIPILSACTKPEPPPGEAPPPPEVITIRFACSSPPTFPDAVALIEFGEKVAEETDGRVEFDFYPAGELFDVYEAPAQLKTGALEMCVGGYVLGRISPGWDAIQLPFLFDDYEHYLRFTQTDAFKAMNASLEAKGIKYLVEFYTPGESYPFNSVRPIEKLEDFQGLKMRVPQIPALVTMCEAFGIQNVTIAGEELMTAFQTGMVDGTFAAILNIPGYGLTENCPYMTKCAITCIPVTIVVSTEWWNSLPPDIQETIMRLLEEAGHKGRGGFAAMREQVFAGYEADPGTVVTELPEAEKARWREAAEASWEKTAAESEEVRMIIEAANMTR